MGIQTVLTYSTFVQMSAGCILWAQSIGFCQVVAANKVRGLYSVYEMLSQFGSVQMDSYESLVPKP